MAKTMDLMYPLWAWFRWLKKMRIYDYNLGSLKQGGPNSFWFMIIFSIKIALSG